MRLRIKQELEKLLFSSGDENRGLVQLISNLVRFFFYIGKQLVRDHCLQRAAALAYVTLLSLIPVTILLFVIFNAFGGLAELQGKLQQILFQHLLADSISQVSTHIEQMLSRIDGRAIGIVGIMALLISAYSVFRTVDNTINQIWKTGQRRRFIQRLTTLWTLLTLAPLFVGLSIYFSAQLEKLRLDQQLVDLSFLLRIFYGLAPFLFTFAALFILNSAVPMIRVKRLPAAIGSLVSALLWEGGKLLFNFYVVHFVSYNKLYGSLGLLPIFLLWIYFTWLMILFGVEVSYTLQNMKGLHAKELKARLAKEERETALPVGRLAMEILFFLAKKFRAGQSPVHESDIRQHLGTADRGAPMALNSLEQAGLTAVAANDEEDRMILLTRDILQNSPAELLQLIQQTITPQELTYSDPFYEEIFALRGKTLQDYLS